MASKTIFTVGFRLPTNKFEYVPINSNVSLADADIILIKVFLPSKNYEECDKFMQHWQEEITVAYMSGKTILMYIPEKTVIKNFRNKLLSNYHMIPLRDKQNRNVKGKNVEFTKEGNILKSYWDVVGYMSGYEATLDFSMTPLLETKGGHAVVGGYLNVTNKGTMFFLPPITLPSEFKPLLKWSDEANIFGYALAREIIALDKLVRLNNELTPPPDWLGDKDFNLNIEEKYLADIAVNNREIIRLQDEINAYNEALSVATIPKQLLYETGIPLEKAIIHGLKIIGFEAENFDDGESEFDIVFESDDEGRFIGEAEGKDTSAIAVGKYRQLEINLQEDFDKDGVEEYAKGILFGNPHRLSHPSKRTDCFTTKVQTSAKRSGIALVNTHELFEVVQYMLNSKNKEYAKQVRECFKNISGDIIQFPDIPVLDEDTL